MAVCRLLEIGIHKGGSIGSSSTMLRVVPPFMATLKERR